MAIGITSNEQRYHFAMNLKREVAIERQIEKIKQELAQLGHLRPGSLSTQYNVCGTPNCRCKASPPQKHGPYYQISYTRKSKSSTKFVAKKDLPEVRRQLKNYARLRLLTDRWIDLATELSNLRIAREKS